MDIRAVLLNQLLLTFVIYHGPSLNGACQNEFSHPFSLNVGGFGIPLCEGGIFESIEGEAKKSIAR